VARILISEPHDDIVALLELVVRRLGHEPVCASSPLDVTAVDAAVIEPGELDGLRLARALRAKGVPVLFTSIYPAESELLDLDPVAYLVKPFPLYTLERALVAALARGACASAAAG
jgi:CheY-like chemotaxis protein